MLERARVNFCTEPDAFVAGIRGVVDEALADGVLSLDKLKMGELFARVLSLACCHGVRLETNFTSVAISIMVVEALGRSLNPQQDILRAALPYLREQLPELMADVIKGEVTRLLKKD